jgi:hypothetical protein
MAIADVRAADGAARARFRLRPRTRARPLIERLPAEPGGGGEKKGAVGGGAVRMTSNV